MFYVAPISAKAFTRTSMRKKVASAQRCAVLRTTSAYRNVSNSSVLVLDRIPPADLLALERQEVYLRIRNNVQDCRTKKTAKR